MNLHEKYQEKFGSTSKPKTYSDIVKEVVDECSILIDKGLQLPYSINVAGIYDTTLLNPKLLDAGIVATHHKNFFKKDSGKVTVDVTGFIKPRVHYETKMVDC